MEKIRFKLEDGGFLEGHFNEDSKYLEFQLEREGVEAQEFKLHKIQVQALIKAINQPLGLGLDLQRKGV